MNNCRLYVSYSGSSSCYHQISKLKHRYTSNYQIPKNAKSTYTYTIIIN